MERAARTPEWAAISTTKGGSRLSGLERAAQAASGRFNRRENSRGQPAWVPLMLTRMRPSSCPAAAITPPRGKHSEASISTFRRTLPMAEESAVRRGRPVRSRRSRRAPGSPSASDTMVRGVIRGVPAPQHAREQRQATGESVNTLHGSRRGLGLPSQPQVGPRPCQKASHIIAHSPRGRVGSVAGANRMETEVAQVTTVFYPERLLNLRFALFLKQAFLYLFVITT